MSTKSNIRLIADVDGWYVWYDKLDNDMISIENKIGDSDLTLELALIEACERFGVEPDEIDVVLG